MNNLIFTSIGLLVMIGIVAWYWRSRKCLTKVGNHTAEHKVIKQRIQITEDKVVDLEIRVKVLEDVKV